jgi:hypothetical protein
VAHLAHSGRIRLPEEGHVLGVQPLVLRVLPLTFEALLST